MTLTPLSKSKGQGHQAALLAAVLARQAAAAVGIGTCWPWETGATLPSARWYKALRRPWGRRGAGAYCGSRRLQLVTDKYDNKAVPTLKLMGPSSTRGHDLRLAKQRSRFFSIQELQTCGNRSSTMLFRLRL